MGILVAVVEELGKRVLSVGCGASARDDAAVLVEERCNLSHAGITHLLGAEAFPDSAFRHRSGDRRRHALARPALAQVVEDAL